MKLCREEAIRQWEVGQPAMKSHVYHLVAGQLCYILLTAPVNPVLPPAARSIAISRVSLYLVFPSVLIKELRAELTNPTPFLS